jgi:hypothetical protein
MGWHKIISLPEVRARKHWATFRQRLHVGPHRSAPLATPFLLHASYTAERLFSAQGLQRLLIERTG